jgi:hypothetical protein
MEERGREWRRERIRLAYFDQGVYGEQKKTGQIDGLEEGAGELKASPLVGRLGHVTGHAHRGRCLEKGEQQHDGDVYTQQT